MSANNKESGKFIGYIEDFGRHRNCMREQLEIMRVLAEQLKAWKVETFDPAYESAMADPDCADLHERLTAFNAAVADLTDFSEIDEMSAAVEKFTALAIFDVEQYSFRYDEEIAADRATAQRIRDEIAKQDREAAERKAAANA